MKLLTSSKKILISLEKDDFQITSFLKLIYFFIIL